MKKFIFNPNIEYQIQIFYKHILITETNRFYLSSFKDILKILNYELDYFYNNKILTFEIMNLKTYEIMYKRKVIRLN